MIAICQKCGARNRLPDVDTHKRYRCYSCKTSLDGSTGDSRDDRGVAADSSTQHERTSVKPLSMSFLLLVVIIAALLGGTAWATADKISMASAESLPIIHISRYSLQIYFFYLAAFMIVYRLI